MGNAYNWDNAARSVDIKVDDYPLPGDVAYWNSSGHVAFVERVDYDKSMNPLVIYVAEYNHESEHDYDKKDISPNNPSGYIHLNAYNECATSYYFNRMDALWAFSEQTREEWE